MQHNNRFENKDRLIRLTQVLEYLPISKSTWWNGIKLGHYPQPIKLGPNTTAWRWSDIQTLIENGIDVDGGNNT